MLRTATLLSFLACSFFTLNAQTLTDPENVPAIGTSVQVHVTAYSDPGAAGSGITWDFSTLGTDSTVTWSAIDPTVSQWYDDMPPSDYLLTNGVDSIFYDVTANGIERVGEDVMFVTFDVQVPFTDGQRELQLPANLGTTWTDLIGATYDITGIGTATRSGTMTGTIDGTGTLILPYGQFTDAVRVHLRLDQSDDAGFADATRARDEWYWLNTFQKLPLLRVISDTINIPLLGVTQVLQTVEWMDAAFSGIPANGLAAAAMTAWPNPAADAVDVTAPAGTRTIELIDATGRTVRSLPAAMNSAFVRVDLSGMAPGAYTLKAMDAVRVLAVARVAVR